MALLHNKRRFILAAIYLEVLVGCSTFPSENQDPSQNNKEAYKRDLMECQEDYPQMSSGVHIKQWIGCMNLKGWR